MARLFLVAAVVSTLLSGAAGISQARLATVKAACDVRQRGAKGDGKSNDAKHLQAALDDPSCDAIVLTQGHTFLSGGLTVRRSNVTLTIEAGAKLEGKPGSIKQCSNEADWKGWCSFLTVVSARNFTLRGAGTLEGGGQKGEHWSTLHVRSTARVRLGDGVRIHCTNSWWCSVMHNASAVHIAKLFIDGSKGRDGIDFVNSRDILIEDSRIEGSDDGLCFKTQADDGLGAWPASNVTVRRCYLSSECCNAIQFGSRTEVDMTGFSFEDIVIGSGRKSAIGVVSMDSANITKLNFRNITIRGSQIATPLFLKLGNRAEGDIFAPSWGHGSKSKRGSYTATIEGMNTSHKVGPICLRGFHITALGGGDADAARTDPPSEPEKYQPRYNGERPSWGWFVRHAEGVSFDNCSLAVQKTDGRPALVLDDVMGVSWTGAAIDTAGKDC